MNDTDTDDLAQATGLAVALLGALLESAHKLPKGEFSRHMANLASVTRETAREQSYILNEWAAIAAQISQGMPSGAH